MCLEDGPIQKTLRRLRTPNPSAVQCCRHATTIIGALKRIEHGQGRDRALSRCQSIENTIDQVRFTERSGTVVDQHAVRREVDQAF